MGTINQTILAAVAVTLAGASAAHAVTVTGTLTVTLSGFDGNLPTIGVAPTDIDTFNGNQSPTGTHNPVFFSSIKVKTKTPRTYTSSVDLTNVPLGITTYNFMQIDPAGNCGSGCTTDYSQYQDRGLIDSGTITVSFTGTGSDSGTFTDTGTFTAKYSGATLGCASSDKSSKNTTDCIVWGTPTVDTFNVPGETAAIDLVNAVDWDLVPQIQLGLSTHSQIGTPLPATLPLFAGGLGALALVGKRRKNIFGTKGHAKVTV